MVNHVFDRANIETTLATRSAKEFDNDSELFVGDRCLEVGLKLEEALKKFDKPVRCLKFNWSDRHAIFLARRHNFIDGRLLVILLSFHDRNLFIDVQICKVRLVLLNELNTLDVDRVLIFRLRLGMRRLLADFAKAVEDVLVTELLIKILKELLSFTAL